MERLQDEMFLKITPRLIRAMEREGHRMYPVLCHGDLWDGNAPVDAATGDPKIFDPASVYAHKERNVILAW